MLLLKWCFLSAKESPGPVFNLFYCMEELRGIHPSILSSSCSFLWLFSRPLVCVLSVVRYLWLNAWLKVPRVDPCSSGRSTCPKVSAGMSHRPLFHACDELPLIPR